VNYYAMQIQIQEEEKKKEEEIITNMLQKV